jgi:hypothetical protein
MRLEGYITCMESIKTHKKFGLLRLNEREHSEGQVVDGRILFKQILTKSNGRVWTDSVQHRDRWRGVANTVIKPSGFRKVEEFLE